MSNVFTERAKANGSKVATEQKKEAKARSTSIEMLGMNLKEQYTDIRVYHRLNDEGQPDFRPSSSGKCDLFGGRTAIVDKDGAKFFISAQIGLRK